MASIPLPALAVQPPQQPDIGANIQRLMVIKSMMNQQQTQQLQQTGMQQENDQRALMLKGMQTIQQIAPDHIQKDSTGKVTGFDYDGLQQDALSKGVPMPILSQLTTMRKNQSDALLAQQNVDAKTIENQQSRNKQAYEVLEGVRNVKDPVEQQQAYQQGLGTLQKIGVDTSKYPQQLPTDPAQQKPMFDSFEAGLAMHAQSLADAKTVADTSASVEKGKESAAGAAAKQAEALWYQQHPNAGAPGVPPETMSAADWMAKNPGKSLSDYNIAMKKIVPAYNFSLMNATGAGQPSADVAKQFGMSSIAFDQAAEKYWTSGQLPPAGRGGPALAMNKAIMNHAAELHPEGSLAANSAEYKANASSLTKLQSNLDQVSSFENTAIKNLDMFTGLAKKAIDSGVPLINAPLRSAAQLLGGQDQASFNAARQVAVNEIAKVTSSPGLSGQLSDSARKEVADFIPASATVGQIMSLANTLKQDMANRHVSYQQQIGDIQKRLGGGGGNTFTVTAPNGKSYSFPDKASLDAFKQKAGIQ